MRPQDIPELRARTLAVFEREVKTAPRYSETDLAKMEQANPGLMHEYTDAIRRRDEASAEIRDRTVGPSKFVSHWRMAELFYVAPEMAAVAAAAADSMPSFELHREDLPAEIGLLYFANSDFGKEFDVITTWGPPYDGQADAIALTIYTCERGDLLYLGMLTIGYGQDQIESHDFHTPEDNHQIKTWALVLRCCWLLMQQRIAMVTEQRPDRASERRLRRANKPVDAVRVITLRQPEHHGIPSSDRTYHHRWVVRGHWRKQWYPSQERNVPIWISPHVKGPDGAPLLAGEKVYSWSR